MSFKEALSGDPPLKSWQSVEYFWRTFNFQAKNVLLPISYNIYYIPNYNNFLEHSCCWFCFRSFIFDIKSSIICCISRQVREQVWRESSLYAYLKTEEVSVN